MMSALGKREQILARAQEREGKAGAPVPTAAGLPQPYASPDLPSQALATICQGTSVGVGLGRGIHSPQPIQSSLSTGNWLAWHFMSPFPMGATLMLKHRQTGLGWQQAW